MFCLAGCIICAYIRFRQVFVWCRQTCSIFATAFHSGVWTKVFTRLLVHCSFVYFVYVVRIGLQYRFSCLAVSFLARNPEIVIVDPLTFLLVFRVVLINCRSVVLAPIRSCFFSDSSVFCWFLHRGKLPFFCFLCYLTILWCILLESGFFPIAVFHSRLFSVLLLLLFS